MGVLNPKNKGPQAQAKGLFLFRAYPGHFAFWRKSGAVENSPRSNQYRLEHQMAVSGDAATTGAPARLHQAAGLPTAVSTLELKPGLGLAVKRFFQYGNTHGQ